MNSNASDIKDEKPHFSHDIITKLKQFKYQVSEGGLCNGLTYMWVQARLANDEKVFYDRLRLIYESDNLVRLVNDSRQKVIEHKPLTADDHKLLDVPSFMEGVSIYQIPEKHTEVFNKHLGQKQIEQVSQFTASKNIEDQKGITEIFNLELSNHNEKEWTTYFDNLREVLKTRPEPAVVISTFNHKMGLKYNSTTDSWDLFDQQLVDFSKDIVTKNIPHDKFGEEVMNIFKRNHITNRLMTRIYSTNEQLQLKPDLKTAFTKLNTADVTKKSLVEEIKEKAKPTFFQPETEKDKTVSDANEAKANKKETPDRP